MKFKVHRYWLMSDVVEVEAESEDHATALARMVPLYKAKAQYVLDSLTSDPDTDAYPVPPGGAS